MSLLPASLCTYTEDTSNSKACDSSEHLVDPDALNYHAALVQARDIS